jgi:putative CocE/NonD family hydrolase
MYAQGFLHYPRDEWWDRFDFLSSAPRTNVPALHISGWYDIWTEGTIRRFRAWQTNGGIGARGNPRLLIGPWSHIKKEGITGCDQSSKDELKPKIINRTMAFLNANLKENWQSVDQPANAVEYWVMTSPDRCDQGGWRTQDVFPEGETISFYLTNELSLQKTKPLDEGLQSFHYDPQQPWVTMGGSTLFHTPPGPRDVKKELDKNHHLLFTSQILKKPFQITGEVFCELYMASDVPSSDVAVLLLDLTPEGRAIILVDGIRRVRWSDKALLDAPITAPGSAVHLNIGMTAYIFQPGHRIGLVVTGGNWPRFERNPQNGEFHYSEDRSRKSLNRVYFTQKKQSRISFTIQKDRHQAAQKGT